MNRPQVRGSGRAFALVELLAVTAVIAVLLGIAYSVLRGARLSAHVGKAESNLKQTSTALELYYLRYRCFPPAGADLAEVLTPFVKNPEVFENPLMDEARPGQTLRDLYHPPHPSQVDKPHYYVTAFVSADGSIAVVLKTGGIVERHDGLRLPVDDLPQVAGILEAEYGRYRDVTPPGDASQPEDPEPPEETTEPGTPDEPPPSDGDDGFDIEDDGSTVVRTRCDVYIHALGRLSRVASE